MKNGWTISSCYSRHHVFVESPVGLRVSRLRAIHGITY